MGISVSPAQPLSTAPSGAGSVATPLRESSERPRGLDVVDGLDSRGARAGPPESGRSRTGSAAAPPGGPTFAHVLQSALAARTGLMARGVATGQTGSRSRLASPAPPSGPLPRSGAVAPVGLCSSEGGIRADKDDDMLDAAFRQTAHLAPPPATVIGLVQPFQLGLQSPSSPSSSGTRAFASLEDLLPALVRKIAWSGDARRGSVRLELGSGALSGATLLVRADGGQVEVALRTPPGTQVEDWRRRIAARLEAKGLDVTTIEVE